MNKHDLLNVIQQKCATLKNGRDIDVGISKASKPVSDHLARLVATKTKQAGNFDCLYGDLQHPKFSQDISILLNNIIVYYPEEGKLDIPVSLPKTRNNNIVVFKAWINSADVREVIRFSSSLDELVDRVALVTVFDLRERVCELGIDVRSVYQKKDLKL